jgi:2-phospho-L-lactate guanylyltransferase
VTDRGIRVVIPMKPLSLCKVRLTAVLDPRQRASLVLWMLERVATAALSATSIAEVVILGGDEPVQDLSRSLEARWQPDPEGDLNAALEGALRETCEAGWTGLLFLAGDLPLIDAVAIERLVESFGSTDIVLATGARGGTNAILCRCGVAFDFQLGADSFQRHLDQAARLGITPRRYESPRTFMDIDTPDDLERLLRDDPDMSQQIARLERFLPRLAM